MNIDIDANSGFCFGVVYAIQMAEDELDEHGMLYCLGDIVHNNMEVERLKSKGLEIIDLAVKYNHDAIVFVEQRLLTGGQINDRQTSMAESYARFSV